MKKTVCVDLDGVLAEFDHWRGIDHIGKPLPGAVDFTHKLSKMARVVIFTVRCNPEASESDETTQQLAARVESWLREHGFYFDEVYTGQGKPLAAAYIDDRAVPCCPQEPSEWPLDKGYGGALLEVQGLLGHENECRTCAHWWGDPDAEKAVRCERPYFRLCMRDTPEGSELCINRWLQLRRSMDWCPDWEPIPKQDDE